MNPSEKASKTTATKTTNVAKKIRGVVRQMNERAHEARKNGEPTAYSFVRSFHSEILLAMEITPIWTENYSALCAAKRQAEGFIGKAEAEGFPRHLCSYATCGLGVDSMRADPEGIPPDAPDGGMELPTVMIGTGMMICDPRYKWYQASQRYTHVPMHVIGLLWPPNDADVDEVRDYYVSYVEAELGGLVEFLETHTGQKMDWDRLDEIIDLANRTERIWWEAYQFRKNIPTPMSAEDAMNLMVPCNLLLGTRQAYDLGEELYNELKERVDGGIGVVPEEKYRLLWGLGLPPWFALKVFDYFKELGAVFAIENIYRPPDPVELPAGAHPLKKLASKFYDQSTYWHKKARNNCGHPDVERLLQWIEEFSIDGVVMHHASTCRTIHCGQIDKINTLKEHTDLPSVILESDLVDVSNFTEAVFKGRVDAFIEIVDNYKTEKG